MCPESRQTCELDDSSSAQTFPLQSKLDQGRRTHTKTKFSMKETVVLDENLGRGGGRHQHVGALESTLGHQHGVTLRNEKKFCPDRVPGHSRLGL